MKSIVSVDARRYGFKVVARAPSASDPIERDDFLSELVSAMVSRGAKPHVIHQKYPDYTISLGNVKVNVFRNDNRYRAVVFYSPKGINVTYSLQSFETFGPGHSDASGTIGSVANLAVFASSLPEEFSIGGLTLYAGAASGIVPVFDYATSKLDEGIKMKLTGQGFDLSVRTGSVAINESVDVNWGHVS